MRRPVDAFAGGLWGLVMKDQTTTDDGGRDATGRKGGEE
jgi:hypothetical protein